MKGHAGLTGPPHFWLSQLKEKTCLGPSGSSGSLCWSDWRRSALQHQRGSTSTRDVIPERLMLLVWAGQGAWLAGRRAKGFEEWVDLQGLSEGLAAEWLRLLPVAAVQGDFLSSSR